MIQPQKPIDFCVTMHRSHWVLRHGMYQLSMKNHSFSCHLRGEYLAKLQVTLSRALCVPVPHFKSSKPIQIGLCMLMSLSIHLHSLHLDAQYGQTWHLSTQFCCGKRTGHWLLWATILLLPTLNVLSDSQVSISLVIYGLWWTICRQVKAHVVLTCTNEVSLNHLLVIVACHRPSISLSTHVH